jgi:hypothetical protein
MGVNDDANETNTRLNLQESNFISLNTPDGSNVETNANVLSSYKKTGDKILFYIKLFFKNKNKSHKTNGRHKHRSTLKHKRHLLKSRVKSARRINSNDKLNANGSHVNKTRKIGAFMRV